jgi:hypothetical protein
MTLLPPLTTTHNSLYFPGIIPVAGRRQHDDSAPSLAAPAHLPAQADYQREYDPLRASARIMPQNHTGGPPGSPRQHSSNGAAGIHRSNSASFSRRPSSAPRANGSGGATSTTDDEDDNRALSLRPPKPPLLRSQSEYASPHREEPDHSDNEDFEWGARHGFEDHYQSEDIISQLANVSYRTLFFGILPPSQGGGRCMYVNGKAVSDLSKDAS